jgi:hypothetical protein
VLSWFDSQHDPTNAKAWIRRATANEQLACFEAALRDIIRALELELPATLQRQAITTKNRLQGFIQRDLAARSAEPPPDTFVTGSQTLRLFLRAALPRTCTLGVPVQLSLAVVNEFGLWSHSILHESQRIPLEFSVIPFDRNAFTSSIRIHALDEFVITQSGRASGMVVLEVPQEAAPIQGESCGAVIVRASCEATSVAATGRVILPVSSLPIVVSESAITEAIQDPEMEELLNTAASIGAFCIRELQTTIHDEAKTLLCFEAPGFLGETTVAVFH